MVQHLCNAFVQGMMRVGYSPSLLYYKLLTLYIPIPGRPIIMMYQNTQAVAIIVCTSKKANYRYHLKKGVKETDIKHWETINPVV